MRLCQDVSEAVSLGSADAVFGLMARELVKPLGIKVFSCSVFNLEKATSRRIYTDRPDLYPVAGLKPIIQNRWTRIVLDRQETFVANTLAEIAEVFNDHDYIGSLGCGAIINMPVLCAGQFMGTVNLLSRPNQYSDEDVAFAKDHIWIAQSAFLMAALER